MMDCAGVPLSTPLAEVDRHAKADTDGVGHADDNNEELGSVLGDGDAETEREPRVLLLSDMAGV